VTPPARGPRLTLAQAPVERAKGGRSPWLVLALGPAAVAWAVLISGALAAVPCFALWMAGAPLGTPWTVPARQSLIVWLVGHAMSVRVDDVAISLLPWGTLVIQALLLFHAGHWTARVARLRSVPAWLGLGLIAGLGYGFVLATAASIARSTTLVISVNQAAITGTLLAGACVLAGACREASLRAEFHRRFPAVLRAGVVAGLVALAALAIAGIALVIASCIANVSDVLADIERLRPDMIGAVALGLLSLAYLPVLGTWALAFALGPGFSALAPVSIFASSPAPGAAMAQSGTLISTDPGAGGAALPVFPLLAAVPQTVAPWAPLLPLLGVIAGVFAGIVIVARNLPSLLHRVGAALICGLIASAGMLVAARLSHGSLGRLRLADLGPQPLAVAGATLLLVTLGAVLAVLAHRQAVVPAASTPDVPPTPPRVASGAHRRPPARGSRSIRVTAARSPAPERPRVEGSRSRRLAERATLVLDDRVRADRVRADRVLDDREST